MTSLDYTLTLSNGTVIDLTILQEKYEEKLEPVFPTRVNGLPSKAIPVYCYKRNERKAPAIRTAKPRVLIPVFPGTNCEYDTARVFEKAGALPEIFVIRNLSSSMIEESVSAFAQKVAQSQIIMIPGGFSGGDERTVPENSLPHFSAIPASRTLFMIC